MERKEAKIVSGLILSVLERAPELKAYQFGFAGGKLKTTGATLKVEVTSGDPVTALENAQTTFTKYARMFDMDPADFGRVFEYRFEDVKITGIAPNRPKFSIKGTYLTGRKRGKEFLFPAEQVKRNLKKVAA